MANKDYYEVLGVDRDADSRAIKRAFLRKARELHPDVSDDPDAEAKFKEVNEAYSVLSDDQKRANYDTYGSADGPAGFGSDYVDMSDFMSGFGMDDLFSSFMGGSARTRQVRTQGRDMALELHISLEEAARGTTKTVAYDRLAPCEDCGGTGSADGSGATTCSHCHGTGTVVTVRRTILGQMQVQSTCPECGGTGKVVAHPCETCSGQGRTPSRERVEVKIPAGIHSGQSIRIAGYGEAGLRGAQAGSLIVTVTVDEDIRFQRQGDDLYRSVSVDTLDAMLGTTIELDGILEDDRVEVAIPAGCQYGQQIDIAGYGMPRQNMHARGNLHVLVQVSVPTNLSESQREMLFQIASELHAERDRYAHTSGDDAPIAEATEIPEPKSRRRPRPRAGTKHKKGKRS